MAVRGCQQQQGSSLIEILIAVLVLSVGLLGIASMQLRAVKNNQSSLTYSIAVIQAQSMADTLLISRSKALAGEFNLALTAPVPTKTDFVSYSLRSWRASLQALLGDSAQGSVDCANRVCVVTVRWNDAQVIQGAITQNIRVEMRL